MNEKAELLPGTHQAGRKKDSATATLRERRSRHFVYNLKPYPRP